MSKVSLFHVLVDEAPYCHRDRPCCALPGELCGMPEQVAGDLEESLTARLGEDFSVEIRNGGCPLAGSGLVMELRKQEKRTRVPVAASFMAAMALYGYSSLFMAIG